MSCEALASSALPRGVVAQSAQLVPAGSFQPPTEPTLENLPEFCRVTGRIENHPTSRIMFEVWLPTRTSNHRFVQVGNTGYAGVIQYEQMATRLREGYATASTDDGTSAPPGVPQEERLKLLRDMERLHDFKGRAVTLTTPVAKSLYSSFYGSTPVHSYFVGYSTGGFEALAVVQRTGDQFDGVLAGCPANNSAALFTQAIWTYQNYQKVSGMLKLIHDAALAACDATADGVKDGVIGDPEHCRFDPVVLTCKSGDQADCLTQEQVEAVRRIYEGPVNPRTGKKTGEQYAPGMPRGSELVWPVSQSQANGTSQPWYGMLLHNSLTFDLATFDFERDVTKALEMTRRYGAQVTETNISKFKRHGGKLLLWAGWNDPLWSQENAVLYYKQISGSSRTGRSDARAGAAEGTLFARLYMAPGMDHCGGGDGANVVDMFWPMVDWVETGRAPQRILATKHVNNKPDQPVEFTRPLCPYPAIAKYSGRGDANSADNFVCAASTSRRK